MSLTYDHGDIVFECDSPGCHAMLETNTSNFEAARNLLRRARWKPSRPNGDDWQHHCPSCQADLFAKNSNRRSPAQSNGNPQRSLSHD